MESLIQLLVDKYDCCSKEEEFESCHQRALMECSLLKSNYADFFNFKDHSTHISGEFTSLLNSDLQIEITGHPLHRSLRYRDICVSEPFLPHVTYIIHHLPPIFMQFYLNRWYPKDSNFVFMLESSWLSPFFLELLNTTLNQIILDCPDEMALGYCCEFLQTRTFLELFLPQSNGIISYDIFHAFSEVDQRQQQYITEMLIGYEENQRDFEFKSKTYECPICLEVVSGADCIQLRGCQHVSCHTCTGNHFTVQIRDSANGGAPTCPQCNETVLQHEIRDTVSDVTYADYERRLLNKTLSEMPDMVACPNPQCLFEHVRLEEDLSQGICPECRLHFCAHCRTAFHDNTACQKGVLVDMSRTEAANLLDRYRAAGADGRRDLEMQYGKANLTNLAMVEDNYVNEAFITRECKRCPSCTSPIMKNGGCDHMTCRKCNYEFYWTTLARYR